MNLAALRKARAEAIAAALKLRNDAKSAARELTGEELTVMEGHLATAADLKVKIEAKVRGDTAAAELDAEEEALKASNGRKTTASDPDHNAPPRAENVRHNADADPKRGFSSPREFFSAVMAAGPTGRTADPRLVPLKATVGSDEQQGGQDPFGGFLIPQGFSPNMLSVQSEGDPTVGRVTAVPMSAPSINIPARTDKTHTASVTGGLRWLRRAETAAETASRMEMEQVQLKANSLMGVNYTTEELLNDSPISVAALIAAAFKEEYGATILNEKLFGTGAGQFLGVVNAPGTVSQAKETGQVGGTIVADNITKMRSRCWGYSQAIWLANHDSFPQLAKLKLEVGTGGVALYQPSMVEDRPDMLLGRPIFYTEFAQTLGTVGDLILGNWSQFLEGTLQGIDMQESIHVRFLTNERTFRATVRNDGQPWWKSALTPKRSAVTMSPFVTLATRA